MNELNPEHLESARKRGMWLSLLSIVLIVCAILAAQQLSSISFRDIWAQSQHTPLLLSFVPMSLCFWFMALRWRALMSISPPSTELSALICAGLLLNYAAPGPVGELGAAWFAHKRYPISFAESLASGVIARLIGLLVAAFVAIIIWFGFDLPIDPTYQNLIYATVGMVSCIFVGLLLLLFIPQLFLLPLAKVRAYLSTVQKIEKAIVSLTEAISLVSKRGLTAEILAVIWSFCAHTCVFSGLLLIAHSLQIEYSFVGFLFTYAITTSAAVLLFALPGSYVGWDALFIGMMVTTADIPMPASIMIAAILRSQQFAYMLLGGLSLSWLLRSSQANLKRQS